MKIVKVNLGKNSYDVAIGYDSLHTLNNAIIDKHLPQNLFIVVDENVIKYHSTKIENIFENAGRKKHYYVFPSGEKYKSFKLLHDIYSELIENNFGRDTTLIAIGGGVVGDLAGFAAATFMRGIKVVNVPTTLLSMVDSSIGGKTSINFLAKKNIVGSFYQPGYVLIDTSFLKTLPVSELKCGAGEIIKYAFLSDKNFFNSLLNDFEKIFKNNNDYLEETIFNCASIKASVVSNDEKELGLRKILNLGHTFAHAYESCLNFKIKHGIAVNAGVISALFLSNELGIMDDKDVDTLLKLPLKLKLPKVLSSLEKDSIFNVMLSDKKNRNGKIKFVLPLEIGKVVTDIEAGKKEIYSALDRTFALIKKQ